MTRLRKWLRVAADRRGVAVVELAMVAPAMCLTLLAFTDFGYRIYVESQLQGALQEAARMATVGDKTGAQIDAKLNGNLAVFSSGATVVIDKKAYSEFSGVGKPEKITGDTVPLNQYNPGDCFEDANPNGVYDADRGRGGLGSPEDVVNYSVTMTFPRMVPLGGFLGLPDTQTIKASTVLRNQPYAARTSSAIVC